MYNLTYKVIDVMKKTKDTITGQLTTGEKQALISCLATTGATHIAISVPLDVQATFISNGTTPSPRTISAEIQDWCDVIHAQNSIWGVPLKVMHRGTLCGAEAIWNAAYYDGSVSMGTAGSASTDGSTTLAGKIYQYLATNVGSSRWLTGDIFSPIPEGTTHAFDGHYWWPAGSQANYVAAYAMFHAITTAYGTSIGKTITFMTHNNFSEVASGYLPSGMFSDQSLVGCDYYGQRQGSTFVNPSDYVTDWQQLYLGKDSSGGGNNSAGGYSQFWGEWGDLSSAVPANIENTQSIWADWLESFYTSMKDNLVSPNGHLIGFNYWGGWEGQNTSILTKTGSGASSVYSLNFRGQILKKYFTTQIPTKPTTTWTGVNRN